MPKVDWNEDPRWLYTKDHKIASPISELGEDGELIPNYQPKESNQDMKIWRADSRLGQVTPVKHKGNSTKSFYFW